MRPVPVVFLRFAFSPQLTVESPVSAVFLFHVANFMPVAPGEGEQAGDFLGRRILSKRTLPGLSGGVSARRAGVLLDVHGAATWNGRQSVFESVISPS